jgi:hypothetical protein
MFVKGKSGNPGGRPKKTAAEAEVEALARTHGPEAIKRLRHWMGNDDGRISVAACKTMLERGFGTPKQTIDATVKDERYVVRAPEQPASAEDWRGKHGPH